MNAVKASKNSKLNVVLHIRNAKVVGSTPIIGTINRKSRKNSIL
ncbi:hypothetical protein BN128_4675 [Cronobacter sakazakii 696]|nr:hypothetical protein BN128_4675 [Cronobacter sakazakii 696]